MIGKSIVGQLLLVLLLCAVVTAGLILLSSIEKRVFGTQHLLRLVGKKNDVTVQSRSFRYIVAIFILLVPLWYRYGCNDQCKISVSNFFSNR